jgi:hypothetical protein
MVFMNSVYASQKTYCIPTAKNNLFMVLIVIITASYRICIKHNSTLGEKNAGFLEVVSGSTYSVITVICKLKCLLNTLVCRTNRR